jgi:hypothetical protein
VFRPIDVVFVADAETRKYFPKYEVLVRARVEPVSPETAAQGPVAESETCQTEVTVGPGTPLKAVFEVRVCPKTIKPPLVGAVFELRATGSSATNEIVMEPTESELLYA